MKYQWVAVDYNVMSIGLLLLYCKVTMVISDCPVEGGVMDEGYTKGVTGHTLTRA